MNRSLLACTLSVCNNWGELSHLQHFQGHFSVNLAKFQGHWEEGKIWEGVYYRTDSGKKNIADRRSLFSIEKIWRFGLYCYIGGTRGESSQRNSHSNIFTTFFLPPRPLPLNSLFTRISLGVALFCSCMKSSKPIIKGLHWSLIPLLLESGTSATSSCLCVLQYGEWRWELGTTYIKAEISEDRKVTFGE